MKTRKLTEGILMLPSIDWDRRLFDALIPLPDGTSYNAYLVYGTEKRALIDATDPTMAEGLLECLNAVDRIDYVISQHTEQDHSGAIPNVLEKFPEAIVLCSDKAKSMLMDHLAIPENRLRIVQDGEVLSLGEKTLRFIYTPWVHWPETMCTYAEEDKILFTCDFFGSHLASTDLYAEDEARVYESAKRYYAEIMMAFRHVIKKNLEKIRPLEIKQIAPSHGPVYQNPQFIIKAYEDWISDTPKNEVVIPYVSMHGSTKKMVDHLVDCLIDRGITAYRFDLAATDLGKLAIALVDAATVVIGTPTVHVGPHPNAVYAVYLANAIRPKARYVGMVGSYGWNTKAVEMLKGLLVHWNVEMLSPVLCKGYPTKKDLQAIDDLAEAISENHKKLGIL